ncbi:zinc-dependent alcohol dehydrogenase, partial [Pseudorhodoferax sp.]|uniref:zinc-dependent alcohol dehydrogenase n=1 Tax=Pseudorhodoferax sp. TaxID=1993553 RepID=UPI002DD63D3D
MLALRKTRPAAGLEWAQVPEPEAPSGSDVLLQVAAAGICGSDVHIYQWTGGYEHLARHMPMTLGHEFSAHVVATGPAAEGVAVGDLVTVLPGIQCMRCISCLRGEPAYFCRNHRGVGTSADGAFARYTKVPAANCLVLPPELDPALGALLEPLCIGDNAVAEGEIRFGDTVLVLGPGTIGQAIARAASWRGAQRVVVVGLDDAARLATARAVGATHTIDLAEQPDLAAAFHAITGGQPA